MPSIDQPSIIELLSAGREERFADRHLGAAEADLAVMVAAVGYGSVDELIDHVVPESIRNRDLLDLPPALTEVEALARIRSYADRNRPLVSMIGRGYHARWVQANTPAGPVHAIAFVIRRESPRYAGRLPDETVADYMAGACGYAGSAAEYLLHTWQAAERVGVRDRYLHRMQALVATRLQALCAGCTCSDGRQLQQE